MSNSRIENTLQIRAMRQEDLDAVQAIDQVSFSMPWSLNAYDYELNENMLSSLWVAELSLQGNTPLIVGMIVVWLIIDEAHIATIAVHPEYRGHGIAEELLSNALAGAIQQGMSSATLEVRANNHAAQRLYQRFGFEVVGLRPRYYRDNQEDALIMTAHDLTSAYQHWLENKPIQINSLQT